MFTFSLLVSIAQDKDLELSYCIPSVRMIGHPNSRDLSDNTLFTTVAHENQVTHDQ